MDIQGTSKAIKDVACDALVVGVVRTKAGQGNTGITLSGAARAVDSVLDGLISQLGADGEFKGSLGEMTTIHTMGRQAGSRRWSGQPGNRQHTIYPPGKCYCRSMPSTLNRSRATLPISNRPAVALPVRLLPPKSWKTS